MEVSKGKKILYSLWLVPIVLSMLFTLMNLTYIHGAVGRTTGEFHLAGGSSEIAVFAGFMTCLGLFILMLITKQKKHRLVFLISLTLFGLLIIAGNTLGTSIALQTGESAYVYTDSIISIVWGLYCGGFFAYCIFQIKSAILYAAYVRSPDYVAKQKRKAWQKMEAEARKVKEENPVSAPSAAAASRIAAAVGTAAPAASAAPAAPAAPKTSPVAAPASAEPAKSVDLNRCTTQELLELPGMALADASRIVKERDENGAYASVEDCVARVGLKPHVAARYLPLLTASAPQATNHPPRRGRALDL